MTAELEALIEKGRRSLGAARRLFGEGDYDFAASRTYYAMFYLAEELVTGQGQSAKPSFLERAKARWPAPSGS